MGGCVYYEKFCVRNTPSLAKFCAPHLMCQLRFYGLIQLILFNCNNPTMPHYRMQSACCHENQHACLILSERMQVSVDLKYISWTLRSLTFWHNPPFLRTKETWSNSNLIRLHFDELLTFFNTLDKFVDLLKWTQHSSMQQACSLVMLSAKAINVFAKTVSSYRQRHLRICEWWNETIMLFAGDCIYVRSDEGYLCMSRIDKMWTDRKYVISHNRSL